MTSKETIVEFKNALFEEYGKDVSLEEAGEILNGMVGYYDLLAKIGFEMSIEKKDAIVPMPD